MALRPTIRLAILFFNPRAFSWPFVSCSKPELILPPHGRRRNRLFGLLRVVHGIARAFDGVVEIVLVDIDFGSVRRKFLKDLQKFLRAARSEERRVGKECRSRWSP